MRWRPIVALTICGAFGLYAASLYASYFSRYFGQDWMVYYTAARAWLDGNLPLIYDGERFTAHINLVFAERLPEPLSFHPWLYPPPFLLLLLPFGLLPFAAGCGLFLAASFACLMAAICCNFTGGWRRWLHGLSLLLAPATGFTIGSGQNAFLTGALLVGGFGLLARRPRLAGMLLGLLTYKPQFWLLTPLALIAGRHWRALATALLTAAAMALASAAVLGIEPWRVWVMWMIDPPAEAYQEWVKWGRLYGDSLFANLVLLGASQAVANAAQAAALLACASAVWWCWRRPLAADLQLATLLAATMLAAPHAAPYDAVLLTVAATILLSRGIDRGFRHGEMPVAMLVWMIQLFNPPGAFRIGLITPLLTLLLIVLTIARAHAECGAAPRPLKPLLSAAS
jgi:alpha-1,2-mannosyltransferase